MLDRPTGESVYDASNVSTGRQSADASRPTATNAITGITAPAATEVSPSCDEIPTISHSLTCIDSNADFFDVGIESLVSLFDKCEAPVNESDDCNNVSVTNVQYDMDRFIADSNISLHYVNLTVNDDNGTSVEVDSLFDSGTQLSVIREDVIESLQCDVLGEVKLLAFDGNMSTGKVISLNARMKGHDASVPIRFVACQNVTQNCLLSLAVYRKLLQNQDVRSVTGQTEGVAAKGDDEESFVFDVQRTPADTCCEVSAQNSSDSDADDTRDENENVDVLPLDSLIDIDNPYDTKVSELADEQRADETLSVAFEFAKLTKGGYFLKSGILFHRTKILDKDGVELIKKLELAHDKLGCHLRVRRTKDRIGLSFMWPTMIKNVVDYCRSCEVCQKRAPIMYRDRVPIEGGVVSVEPVFSHFFVDALGPLFNHKVEYNYCLVFLNHTSRFPHAVAVRNLTAKSCCEAMLSLWQFTGFPTRVTGDNAGNFTAELTREFLR